MYIPTDSIVASPIQTRRIFIQGKPKSGKTTAALTFPSPIVVDYDSNLPLGANIPSIPIWSEKWCAEYTKTNRLIANAPGQPPNRRDIFKHWLRANISKFGPDQTLIIDSWGFLQNAFDQQTDLVPMLSKGGEVDKFAFWKMKIAYSVEICEMIKAAPCNVVVTCHETIERDKEGTPTGKLEPLMTGQFKDQLKGHFTDCYRQVAENEKTADGKLTGNTLYLWQIKSDGLADCSCSVPGLKDKFVPANYNSLFGAYMQKQTTK